MARLRSVAMLRRLDPWLRRLDPWLPPLGLMAIIYFFSAQPDLSTGLGTIDLIGRKLVHAALYALLCVLWWRALRTPLEGRTALAVAFAVTVAYAVSDELHQTTVPGRNGSPIDVAIDSLGAVGAAAALRRRGHG